MEMEINNFLLSSAEAYAKNATDIFNMFLTVLFSSFAFAAALPLRNIGNTKNIGFMRFSTSSVVIGGALAAFYVISFISFQKSTDSAQALLKSIVLPLPDERLQEVAKYFQPDTTEFFGLGWPSIGFIVGAICGLIVFLWVTNVERPSRESA